MPIMYNANYVQCTTPIKYNANYVQCHSCTMPIMYNAQCQLCAMSIMYNANYVQYQLCTMSIIYNANYAQCIDVQIPDIEVVTQIMGIEWCLLNCQCLFIHQNNTKDDCWTYSKIILMCRYEPTGVVCRQRGLYENILCICGYERTYDFTIDKKQFKRFWWINLKNTKNCLPR